MEENAKSILEIPDCKIYEGKKLIDEDTLRILYVVKEKDELYFLATKNWTCLLFEDLPCLQIASNFFMLPKENQSNIAIMLPENLAADEREAFESILSANSALRQVENSEEDIPAEAKALPAPEAIGQQNVPVSAPRDRTVVYSLQAASKLDSGSQLLADSIQASGRFIARYVKKGSSFLRSKLKSNEQPTPIQSSTKAVLQGARVISGAAFHISAAILQGAIASASLIGTQIADYIDNKTGIGSKIAAQPTERTEALKTLTLSSINSVVVVYEALHKAGLDLLAECSLAVTEVVSYKYGQEAGDVTKQSLFVVHDFAKASSNLSQIGTKAVAKKTLGGAAVKLLSTPEEKEAEEQKSREEFQSVRSQAEAGMNIIKIASAVSGISSSSPLILSSSSSSSSSSQSPSSTVSSSQIAMAVPCQAVPPVAVPVVAFAANNSVSSIVAQPVAVHVRNANKR